MRPKFLMSCLGIFFPFVFSIGMLLGGSSYAQTYYIDASSGNDSNSGTSTTSPWQTLSKVNSFTFQPGDYVLFKRGETWRGQLVAGSGNSSAYLTYGAYGEGAKPLFLGSINRSNTSDWSLEGSNIWTSQYSFGVVNTVGNELLNNPSFDTGTQAWSIYVNTGAGASGSGSRDTVDFDSAPAGYKAQVVARGASQGDIQLFTTGLNVQSGKCYVLTFRAKASQPFSISQIKLMKGTSPWSNYSSNSKDASPTFTTSWATYQVIYKANTTASDGRLTFYLGTAPSGTALYLDSLSFKESERHDLFDVQPITVDVGNIIFSNEAVCGVKVWEESDLNQQGEFWYDEVNDLVKIYSTSNPASYYTDIELALRTSIINYSGESYTIFDGLALKYGGAHGFGGGSTAHLIIRNCDISYIGGGDQFGGTRTTRYGNGIEFWNNAHDHLVEGNRIWEIYDAALTNQGMDINQQYNITYRNNIIWNSEYSFELWDGGYDSTLSNIYFENNTCFNAGYGWGHAQRGMPTGRHICIYHSKANTSKIFIRNNVFYESAQTGIYLHFSNGSWVENEMVLDNNLWYQSSGNLFEFRNDYYDVSQFALYQAQTGKDANSIMASSPGFIDAANNDYRLLSSSLLIDKGAAVNRSYDIDGNPAPIGTAHDIGAYEFQQVLDDKPPTINYLKLDGVIIAQTITVNTLTPQISFSIEDDQNTFNVNVKLDGVVIDDLESEQLLLAATKDVEVLEPGSHILSFKITDAKGNVTSSNYTLNVPIALVDTVSPTINYLKVDGITVDQSITLNTLSPLITYSIEDDYSTFNVITKLDGVVIDEVVSDQSQLSVSIPLDNLLPGNRILNLEVSDAIGNSVTRDYSLNVPWVLTDNVTPSIKSVLLDGADLSSQLVIYNQNPTISIRVTDNIGLNSLGIDIDSVVLYEAEFTEMIKLYDLNILPESPLSLDVHDLVVIVTDKNGNLQGQKYSFYVADQKFTKGKQKKIVVGKGRIKISQIGYEITTQNQLSLEIETSTNIVLKTIKRNDEDEINVDNILPEDNLDVVNVLIGDTRIYLIQMELLSGLNIIECGFEDSQTAEYFTLTAIEIIYDARVPQIDAFIVDGVQFDIGGNVTQSTPTINIIASDDSIISSVNVVLDDETIYSSEYNTPTVNISFKPIRALTPGVHTIKVEVIDNVGTSTLKSYVINSIQLVEEPMIIGQVLNFPNPFSSIEGTSIGYELNRDVALQIKIYDMRGQLVKIIDCFVGDEGGREGYNKVRWDGTGPWGEPVGSGVYLGQIFDGKKMLGKVKMVIINK